jgi:hypothetical protein
MHAPRMAPLGALLCALLATASPAEAQVHWDASAQAGAMKRFVADRPPGARDASVGPAFQLAAHVALLPLIRVGGWVAHDLSPLGGDAAPRSFTSGGVRIKGMSPWPRGALRAWLFAGFGYAGVYAPSYRTSLPAAVEGAPAEGALVHGAGGAFFEVPVGIGASYKLRKPWELSAELGLRTGFGHSGSVYETPGRSVVLSSSPGGEGRLPPQGIDRLAVGLTVGVLADL